MAMDRTVVHISDELVHRLVSTQFSQWSGLPIRAVTPAGWCNTTFRLGEQMLIRLPRSAAYAAQQAKEHRWLPRLAARLPLHIPDPLAIGAPALGYPWPWSIFRWIPGEVAMPERIADPIAFATSLALFARTARRRCDGWTDGRRAQLPSRRSAGEL